MAGLQMLHRARLGNETSLKEYLHDNRGREAQEYFSSLSPAPLMKRSSPVSYRWRLLTGHGFVYFGWCNALYRGPA